MMKINLPIYIFNNIYNKIRLFYSFCLNKHYVFLPIYIFNILIIFFHQMERLRVFFTIYIFNTVSSVKFDYFKGEYYE